jgi:hypothetical protein
MNEARMRRLEALLDKEFGTVEEGEPRIPLYKAKARTAEEELAREHRRCQLNALLDEQWGKRPGPKLKLLRGGRHD